jgi:hypothetical protein
MPKITDKFVIGSPKNYGGHRTGTDTDSLRQQYYLIPKSSVEQPKAGEPDKHEAEHISEKCRWKLE